MSRNLLFPEHTHSLFLTFVLCIGLNACNLGTDEGTKKKRVTAIKTSSMEMEQVVRFLTQTFDSTASDILVVEGDTIQDFHDYRKAYQLNKFQPFWLNEEGITDNVSDYIKVLDEIRYDGLMSEDYYLSKIKSGITSFTNNTANTESIQAFELLLTTSFYKLSKDILIGKDTSLINKKDWKNKNDSLLDFAQILYKSIENNNIKEAVDLMRPNHPYYNAFKREYIRLDSLKSMSTWTKIEMPQDSLAIGTTNINIPAIRKRLFSEIHLPLDTFSSEWNQDLISSIKKYQYQNQIKVTGKLDTTTLHKLNGKIEDKLKTLALNMERLRWLKHDFPQPYIWVDVPKMELNYIENDSTKFNMRVVVGRPGRATTMLDAKLENIVLSPPWTVPPTIMKEEVVPGIARRGGSYLARRGLKAYDRRGRVVNASAINSKNYRKFSIGQAPGYRSSLGEVKFNLPNPWSIYLHDTPHREDFVKSYRAFSSGCIRVHHPKEFAAFLLRDTTNYSLSKIDSICKMRKTIFVPMKRKVEVHIVYLTNALDSVGNVMYLKDIYKWDKS